VGPTTDDDDFSEEIQDIRGIQTDTPRVENEILYVRISKGSEWLSFRKQKKEFFQHHECCFGINH